MCKIKGNKPEAIRQGSPPDARKLIIAKAIVDRDFRQMLFDRPGEIFAEVRLGKRDLAAIERLKTTLPALDGLVSAFAGEISSSGRPASRTS